MLSIIKKNSRSSPLFIFCGALLSLLCIGASPSGDLAYSATKLAKLASHPLGSSNWTAAQVSPLPAPYDDGACRPQNGNLMLPRNTSVVCRVACPSPFITATHAVVDMWSPNATSDGTPWTAAPLVLVLTPQVCELDVSGALAGVFSSALRGCAKASANILTVGETCEVVCASPGVVASNPEATISLSNEGVLNVQDPSCSSGEDSSSNMTVVLLIVFPSGAGLLMVVAILLLWYKFKTQHHMNSDRSLEPQHVL